MAADYTWLEEGDGRRSDIQDQIADFQAELVADEPHVITHTVLSGGGYPTPYSSPVVYVPSFETKWLDGVMYRLDWAFRRII